ncbi:MAG: hypothetical protein ACOYT4_04505 [Nanoarchaeota archaeon]
MAGHTNQWLLAIFTVVILGLIVWIIQTGVNSRPLVGYKLGPCPKEIGSQYINEVTKQSVKLGISNTGDTQASIILHFHGKNITLLNETKRPYNVINGSDVFVHFTALENSQNYYFDEEVYFEVNKSVDSFSYNYEVLKNSDKSISGFINNLFGEIKGYYPTQCKYQRKTNSQFVLVE